MSKRKHEIQRLLPGAKEIKIWFLFSSPSPPQSTNWYTISLQHASTRAVNSILGNSQRFQGGAWEAKFENRKEHNRGVISYSSPSKAFISSRRMTLCREWIFLQGNGKMPQPGGWKPYSGFKTNLS